MRTTKRNRKPLTPEQVEIRMAFEAYWAGSASASVMRDYREGRAVVIDCDSRSARRREQGLSGSSTGAANFPGRR